MDELHFENHKFQVQCNKTDVVFPFRAPARHRSRVTGSSLMKDWFDFGESFQVMLPCPGGRTTMTCVKDSNVAELVENLKVYWLQGSATESTDGAPLCIQFRVARLVVDVKTNSESEFSANATQLEKSEETRRLKHKTSSRHANKDEHDARQHIHLQRQFHNK